MHKSAGREAMVPPSQNDMAWRHRIGNETLPLDFPCLQVSRRSPISWNYGEAPSRLGTAWTRAPASCSASSASLAPGHRLRSSASLRTISSSRGLLRSAGASSMASQAVRSSVLSLELESERELREAAEQELVRLRAELAEQEVARGPSA
mmetsp:Transcript_35192/g.111905  ORF Transcript_35192/g.111905 Transcript_35192/m.111905 type:complete len:150 (-) Transcript_35192:206-655(-)